MIVKLHVVSHFKLLIISFVKNRYFEDLRCFLVASYIITPYPRKLTEGVIYLGLTLSEG